ncbi:MAG: hypothetical protein LBP24_04720 [Coriobacteriales bacterium]|jgi:septal ring factor EnvC (AmiA/AmiB activator)|nr:hypothetical protein [Coriobacteriales bacterium]
MIGRGRQGDVYLYEVTEQDLLLDEGIAAAYRAGNVLMFGDRHSVDLGNEFARAEDLAAAREYLSREDWRSGWQEDEHLSKLAALKSQIDSQDESLRSLTEKIEQRDELLRDLSESLKTQRQDNELLHVQLERTRAQLAVDELKHNELFDDLQQVSAETHTIENTLERVMDEKFRLEQELAERITDLVELNLQNDDLKRQLLTPPEPPTVAEKNRENHAPAHASALEATGLAAEATDAAGAGRHGIDTAALNTDDSRVLTMASGKKIHVLHEFPAAPKQTAAARVAHAVVSLLRVVAIVIFAALVLSTASIVATAQVNGISFGAALNLIMGSVGLS